MPKKKDSSKLGHSLVKDRFGANSGKKIAGESLLHTSEIDDGQDWARLKLQSVTQQSSFQEFLDTATLAGKEFQAEKLNATLVAPSLAEGLLTKAQEVIIKAKQNDNSAMLKIPRRPLNALSPGSEEEAFLEWRRSMTTMEEKNEDLIMTPYERNIEVWRELWRTVTYSKILVQVVDARNPLLFRSEDLEKYVKETDENKENILLLNKADLLTENQRMAWAEYFKTQKVKVAFFSALLAQDEVEELSDDKWDEDDRLELTMSQDEPNQSSAVVSKYNIPVSEYEEKLTTSHIWSRKELVNYFKAYSKKGQCVVGFVGYPNVGKSSTINVLLRRKKCAVSSTPGKTKHMQKLSVALHVDVCDCPGLVMPSFVFTKADMVINGILPVDQLREAKPPVAVIAKHIPRHILEEKYGFILPLPLEGDDPNRAPTADEVLNAHGYNRGFMTQRGLPDTSRSARYIIKDYLAGDLLYCHAPPGVDQTEYHQFPPPKKIIDDERRPKIKHSGEDLDKMFFAKTSLTAHVKGHSPCNFRVITGNSPGSETSVNSTDAVIGKPWKRHHNKNKKEKLRRVYADLDK